jgi:DNA primase
MDAIEEVRARLSIEDVISEYVPIKRAGRNWKGLSPFSSEKTPSFVVSPEKQIWKDFSSGKGGSMFDFVMEVEGLDFKGALELLARKAGVDLEQYQSPTNKKGPNKDRLYELLDLSAKFYQVQFSKNQKTLSYVLKKRKFTKETALAWRLGYSPNTGMALSSYAKSKGFSEVELQQAGLQSKGYKGQFQDMFRGRLMIPLQDPQGKVIGFTARLLENDDYSNAPKYINTPQTVLYDKSRHIYGLNFAKDAIRKNKYVVIVEGNLDVISSHQAGVPQVVATAGTALTEPNLKTLGRFTGDIRLCFDADKAGIAATERAIPIASRVKISLGIIDLPSGIDPDELIQQDPKLWKERITKNIYALDWLMERYRNILDLKSAQGKREYSDILLPIVRGLADPVERDHYLSQISKELGVSQSALTQKFQKVDGPELNQTRRTIKVSPPKLDIVAVENQKLQDKFLSLMLMRQTLREFLDLATPEMLYTTDGQALLDFLKKHPDFDGKKRREVQNIADYVKIESLLYEELYQGLELNELHDEAARLQAELVTKFIKTQKKLLSELQRQTTNDVALRELQEKDKQYNQLLNKVKGITRAKEY